MTTQRHGFTVIENRELIEENNRKERTKSYQSNPTTYWQSESLREKFAKYVNQEAGRKFTIQDLLNC